MEKKNPKNQKTLTGLLRSEEQKGEQGCVEVYRK